MVVSRLVMAVFGECRLVPDNKTLFACGLHKGTNPLGAVQTPLVISFDTQTKEAGKNWSIEGYRLLPCSCISTKMAI